MNSRPSPRRGRGVHKQAAQPESEAGPVPATLAGVNSDPGQPVFLPADPFVEFHDLVHRHHLAKEHQALKDLAGAESTMDYLNDSSS